MRIAAGLLSLVPALLCVGCASVETEEGQAETEEGPAAQFQVTVENNTDWPVVVRIAGLLIGEAQPTGTSSFTASRRSIAGRRVSVCVDPIGSSRRRCHPGQFVVPRLVQKITITVPRTGQIRVSAL
jgi:hypothetical protein